MDLEARKKESFLRGIRRVLDIEGSRWIDVPLPRPQKNFGDDAHALRGDWETVGKDISSAIEKVMNEQAE